jgi:hypothetical protein
MQAEITFAAVDPGLRQGIGIVGPTIRHNPIHNGRELAYIVRPRGNHR